jgi:hypothetical protein
MEFWCQYQGTDCSLVSSFLKGVSLVVKGKDCEILCITRGGQSEGTGPLSTPLKI